MMFRTVAGGLLAVAIAVAGSATIAHATAGDSPTLAGSWHVTVMLTDCVTGAARAPFHSLLTFGVDGTLVETTNNATFKPGQRSPGHGVWRRTGGSSYSAYSDAFIMFSSEPSVAPPAPAFTRGLQRISQTIKIDHQTPDAFTSAASVEFFDENGTLLLKACATATGTRFE